MKKLKIISDGSPRETYLVDAETGERLDYPITSVDWRVGVQQWARARVEFLDVELDVVGRSRLPMHAFRGAYDAKCLRCCEGFGHPIHSAHRRRAA